MVLNAQQMSALEVIEELIIRHDATWKVYPSAERILKTLHDAGLEIVPIREREMRDADKKLLDRLFSKTRYASGLKPTEADCPGCGEAKHGDSDCDAAAEARRYPNAPDQPSAGETE